jgi:DNA-binding transcriptional LysR family regulator
VDLDLGVIADLGPEVRTHTLFAERLVGLAAAGHRLAAGRVTLRRLAAVDHVAVSRRGRTHGPLDDVLASHGLSRRVVAVVPTYTAAAHIIASSGLTGLVTAGYASQVAALTGARVYEIPAELPTLPISRPGTSATISTRPTTGSGARSPRSSAGRDDRPHSARRVGV